MELLQLKKFCHAAQSGNFTETAKSFGVPPSDISQSVRRLERELGVALFTRRANAVVLNARGEAFAAQVRQALALLDDAAAAAADRDDCGEVHLCVNTNRRIVMETVEHFRRLYPNVSVKTAFFADPTDRSFDLMISAEDERLRSYERTALLSEQMAVAVGRQSPWCAWDGADLAALCDAPFITMGEGSSLHGLTVTLCREAGFVPRIAVQSDDPYYVRRCVELGLGVAIVPLFSWQGQFSQQVQLHPLSCRRTTYLYTASGRYLPRCARRFAMALEEACSRQQL